MLYFIYLFIFLSKTQTALHWAAKHGRADIVKLLAGTHGIDVNGKTVSNSYSLCFVAPGFKHGWNFIVFYILF